VLAAELFVGSVVALRVSLKPDDVAVQRGGLRGSSEVDAG